MLIQELARQDRILHSVGFKLVGSRLDRVSLETRRLRYCVQYVQILCKDQIVLICSSTHTSFMCLVFRFNRFRFSYIWFLWIDRIKTSLHGLMYIRFDLYTSILHLFRKTYFDSLFHEFGVLYLNKTYFWISCQKHRYNNFHVYQILFIYNMLKSYFNIMSLYLHEFWRKRFSISKSQFLENTIFGLRQIFKNTKMVQIIQNMCLILPTHIFISKI